VIRRHRRAGGGVGPVRTGLVRANRHAVCDDGGDFNAYGLSCFYAPWGYKFDRGRLEQNLADARDGGADYVRKLGSVGPDGWTDRPIDPTWPDYDAVIAGSTDLAYDVHGMRTKWTIFGGSQWTTTPESRAQLVDRFAAMARGREHKIFAFEISNEGQAFNGDLNEIRALGRRLKSQVPNIVALTTSDGENMCALYGDSGIDAATMHYQRDFGGDDVVLNGVTYHFRPVRQPWGYPGEYDKNCGGRIPLLVFNNEPIGIQSSGNMDDLPLDIAAAYVTTFIAQNGAYVFHTGAGIRGGGVEDITPGKPYTPRSANFRDQPTWSACTTALKNAKAFLPPGLANWTRKNSQWSDCPFVNFDKEDDAGKLVQAYHTVAGPDVYSIVMGLRQPVTAWPRQAMALDILDVETCQPFRHLDLGAGEAFTIEPDRVAVLLKGTIR
jgi:hypothetical protein